MKAGNEARRLFTDKNEKSNSRTEDEEASQVL